MTEKQVVSVKYPVVALLVQALFLHLYKQYIRHTAVHVKDQNSLNV